MSGKCHLLKKKYRQTNKIEREKRRNSLFSEITKKKQFITNINNKYFLIEKMWTNFNRDNFYKKGEIWGTIRYENNLKSWTRKNENTNCRSKVRIKMKQTGKSERRRQSDKSGGNIWSKSFEFQFC